MKEEKLYKKKDDKMHTPAGYSEKLCLAGAFLFVEIALFDLKFY